MNFKTHGTVAAVMALAVVVPAVARAQTAPRSEPAGGSNIWTVVGGASTALRGDCQDCEEESGYLQTGSVLAGVGYRLSSRADVGIEVFWVPATSTTGDHIRSTFVEATGSYRPWQSRGFFLKGGMGMAFVRNWVYDASGTRPPFTSKALALTYGAGWTLRQTHRVALQLFGAQHVAALGDLVTSQSQVENVVGNFWSVGAAIVVR